MVIAAGFWVCMGAPVSLAAEGSGLSVNGFGTAGVAYIDEPDGWAYTRTLTQANNNHSFRADLDSRLGLQLNYQPTDKVELVVQALASHLDADATLSDSLQLAFVAFRPNADWTLRVGRVNLDAYVLSDHRDVGFTYDYVRPPVEFYSRIPPSLDGADLSRVWLSADVQWRATLLAGRTSAGTGDVRLHIEPLFGITVSREAGGLLLRASAIHAKFANNLGQVEPLIAALRGVELLPQPQVAAEAGFLAEALNVESSPVRYFGFGAQYDKYDWMISTEINSVTVPQKRLSSFTTGYASVGRRFGAVSVFVMQSMARRDGSALTAPDWATPLAPFGPAVAQQAQYLGTVATNAANTISGDQQTTSLGVRWNVAAKLALKAQWDHVHVAQDGGSLWSSSTPAEQTSNVVTVTVDFVF